MSVVLGVDLISRRRSRRNTAGAGLPPSSLQLVPVTRIEKFVADGGRTMSEELKKTNESESDGTFAMKRRRFTNTALPVFSGAECWFQHFHIKGGRRIFHLFLCEIPDGFVLLSSINHSEIKSIGGLEETVALQLFAHLKGEALNVVLLLTRESWTGLVSGLSAYYQSPGRLVVLRRRFESAFHQPGLDPATFATDLGILAIQGFEDIKEPVKGSARCVSNWMDLHRVPRSGKLWIVVLFIFEQGLHGEL